MITPANLPFFQFFSATKTPLAGGKLHSYLAGTDTPADTYTDYTGSTKHQNPITLDSLGTANVWVDSGIAYKFVLKNAAGSTLKTWDGINNYAQTYTDSDEIQGEGASTDLTTSVQAKLTALGNAGGGTLILHGIVYCASDINLPDHVHLVGVTPSIGSARYTGFDPSEIENALYLSNSATINVGAGSTISDLLIINANLAAAMPFANTGAATTAINAFAGTAIEGLEKEDVFLTRLRILGFAQAVKMDTCDRTKIEWVDIDCTAGVWIKDCYDIDRLVNVHCWLFVSYGYAFSSDSFYRSGSAFKVTGHFDGGMIENCFSYGWAIGYDIQCLQNVTLSNCHCDNWGGTGAPNNGNIGYKFSSTAAHCMMTHCGASGQDVGLLIDGANIKINVDSCQFWGNETHVNIEQCISATFTGDHFMYLNTEWTPTYQIEIDGAGYIQIHGCVFHGVSNTVNAIYLENQTYPFNLKDNLFIDSATCVTFAATSACTSQIYGNNMATATAGFSFGTAAQQNLADIAENGYIPGLDPNSQQSSYSGLASSWKAFGAGAGNIHRNYLSGGSATSPTVPGTNQVASAYYTYGWDGDSFGQITGIRTQTSGSNGFANGSTPGSLVFSTTPNAAAASVDRVAISPDGHFYPTHDNAYTNGSASLKWAAVYATNGTIQTSNESDKTDIQDTPLGLSFIEKLRPVSCKFKVGGYEPDAEDKKTLKPRKGVRTHHLLLAQDVKAAADDAGVDFAGWGLADKDDPNSDQWLNYSQFIAPLISAVKELSSRVKALEGKQ